MWTVQSDGLKCTNAGILGLPNTGNLNLKQSFLLTILFFFSNNISLHNVMVILCFIYCYCYCAGTQCRASNSRRFSRMERNYGFLGIQNDSSNWSKSYNWLLFYNAIWNVCYLIVHISYIGGCWNGSYWVWSSKGRIYISYEAGEWAHQLVD